MAHCPIWLAAELSDLRCPHPGCSYPLSSWCIAAARKTSGSIQMALPGQCQQDIRYPVAQRQRSIRHILWRSPRGLLGLVWRDLRHCLHGHAPHRAPESVSRRHRLQSGLCGLDAGARPVAVGREYPLGGALRSHDARDEFYALNAARGGGPALPAFGRPRPTSGAWWCSCCSWGWAMAVPAIDSLRSSRSLQGGISVVSASWRLALDSAPAWALLLLASCSTTSDTPAFYLTIGLCWPRSSGIWDRGACIIRGARSGVRLAHTSALALAFVPAAGR